MGTTDPQPGDSHAAEAKERWGKTDSYKESSRRTKEYDAETWAKIKAENEDIEASFAKVFKAGVEAEAPEATALAERSRMHIDRWYYPCSPAMHSGLAAMYTAESGFKEHYEERADGLAQFVAASILANESSGDHA